MISVNRHEWKIEEELVLLRDPKRWRIPRQLIHVKGISDPLPETWIVVCFAMEAVTTCVLTVEAEDHFRKTIECHDLIPISWHQNMLFSVSTWLNNFDEYILHANLHLIVERRYEHRKIFQKQLSKHNHHLWPNAIVDTLDWPKRILQDLGRRRYVLGLLEVSSLWSREPLGGSWVRIG